MSPQMQQPLYTTVPWSPSNFYPKDQEIQVPTPCEYSYPTLITPIDYPTNLLPATDINTFPLSSQPESRFISPITPDLIAPAPTPESLAYSNQQQIAYPIQSPWSSCSTNHQLLTPQYPFFPSTIFTYPQPSQQFSQSQFTYPQNDLNTLPHYTFPINQNSNTQGNSTEDLYQDNNTAYTYSTSFDTTHHHDMFQLQPEHEAWVHNASIDNRSQGGSGTVSEEMGYKIEHELIDPRLQEINQSIPQSSIIETNSINIDQSTRQNFIPKSNIFRDSRSSPRTTEPTIYPKLNSGVNMVMGGEQSRAGGTNDPEHDRNSAIPIPIPPCPANIESHQHGHEDQSPTPTKRGRWSTSSLPLFSRKSTTTPLRKRRPPQLHLPPPSANMRIPTATIHSAPAASFSLDLLVPPNQRVDTNAIVPQEPPPVEGWISPEQRPVPPLGYTVPGSELVPKIFEYGNQNDIPVPAPPAEVVVDNNTTTTPAPPQALPFQPYEPKAIPRVTSDPQLRIPNTSTPSPPAPYIIVPGLNGFEISYWRPQTRSHSQYPDPDMIQSGSFPIHPQPPTTAAPWEVSVPPMDPSAPPSTASSLRSISTLDGHFIPQPQEVEPVVYLNHELRNRGKTKVYHPPRYHVPTQEKKETWAICEVCNATISRTSDLQVSPLLPGLDVS
jgi:hypothetical protein